jgi:transposase
VQTSERPAAGYGVTVPLPPLESFFSLFRDDNDCLEFLWRSRYSSDGTSARCPECGELREFLTGVDKTAHLQWQCTRCNCFLSPIAGTIFQKSQIPLHVYFDAMGALAEPGRPTRAEDLAYELGVSFTMATELIEVLDGRLDAHDASSPSFIFDV